MAKLEIKDNENKKYKVKVIQNSIVYIKKSPNYLLKLYHLVLQKNRLDKKKYLKALITSLTS